MRSRPHTPLDYSSTAEEQKRDEQQRQEQKEKLENYNEATFGERHPYAIGWALLGVFAFAALTFAFVVVAPWPLRLTVALVGPITFFIYVQWRRW